MKEKITEHRDLNREKRDAVERKNAELTMPTNLNKDGSISERELKRIAVEAKNKEISKQFRDKSLQRKEPKAK